MVIDRAHNQAFPYENQPYLRFGLRLADTP